MDPSERRNPGKLDSYNREAKMILQPDFWEGVRVDFNKQVNANFVISHGLTMGDSRAPPMYTFSANYMGPLAKMSGRIDTTGMLSGRWMQQITRNIALTFQTQMNSQQAQGQVEADYSGSDFTVSALASSVGQFRASYFQSVTRTLALGVALSGDPSGVPGFNFHLRQVGRNHIFTAVANCMLIPALNSQIPRPLLNPISMLGAAYVHRVSDKVSVATEFQFDTVRRRTVATVGYQFDMRLGVFTGHVVSNGMIGATMEHRIPMGPSFLMSGVIDYVRKEYSFGFGVSIG